MVRVFIVALFLWIFLYQTINVAIFEKSEKKCSRKATKQGQKAAIKGCIIKGGHLSPQNKGKEQPKGCK